MLEPQRIGIIDAGTNTFHLLLFEWAAGQEPKLLYRTKQFVFLAEEGINKIGPAPYERALTTLSDYRKTADEHGVTAIKALGTAALRTAENAQNLIQEAAEKTGIQIEVIDGDREAQLICYGVRAAVVLTDAPVLIMDIGGGSVEFILCNRDKIYWKQSFPVGASVMKKNFHTKDPLPLSAQAMLRKSVTTILEPLQQALQTHRVTRLIGVSGAFNTVAALIANRTGQPGQFREAIAFDLDLENVQLLFADLYPSTLKERLAMPGMVPNRAPMMVVGPLLIDEVLNMAGIQQLTVSRYAMKEGMLAEMTNV